MAKKTNTTKTKTIIQNKPVAENENLFSGADFPIVGIGASAGGLAAFEEFFSGMPTETDPGMAFVLVQHLAPDHKSILTDLVRRYTRMQVFEVEDGMRVQPNCAYIIPPNRDMAFLNGALQLLEPTAPRGRRLPIDFFFRTLAQDQRERAIGIVLSGTGSDGTQGIRAIKGEGGMVMAQTPASTEYDGMPRSAISTGLVDFELPPAEMAAQLITYAAHAFGKPAEPAPSLPPKGENALKKIFILLRAQIGHDFSQYKPNTIQRRIERRMALQQIETMDEYIRYLQQTEPEVEALFRDMLIGVTNFFRDPQAFQTLEEKVIPKLFAGKPDDYTIRVWVPGCSTGEEAYSIAILLAEHQKTLKQNFRVQVFATDIDSQAIATARAGLYLQNIAADISPERLEHFFTTEEGGAAYRIHKNIRDMVIFSEQSLIKDPPFSKLDLLSCRNLLIYIGTELQKKLIPLFHYALNPDGFLFLGTSETVSEFGDLFSTHDRKAKLFQRKENYHNMGRRHFLTSMLTTEAVPLRVAPLPKIVPPNRPPLRELTEQALLQQIISAGVLVNRDGDILYLHGRTGIYLEPAPGEAGVNNILKMAREGLERPLTTSLHKAVLTNQIVHARGLQVKTNSHFTQVNLTIRPLDRASKVTMPLYLVILEEAPPASQQAASDPGQPAPGSVDGSTVNRRKPADGNTNDSKLSIEERINALNQQLRSKDEYLQTTNEELETTNEELKSSVEEMQSVNEELQSTNEELETSKEELQSVNEELATVNAELQNKVADLSQANNDMNNLLAGTGIATLFLDHNLRIMRYTPSATQIINLIPLDVGRPVAHIVSNLVGYDNLMKDLQTVLDKLVPIELEVKNTQGKWYTLRIQPYRTLNNVIEGAVITFVDITETKQIEEALQKATALLNLTAMIRDSQDAIIIQNMDGRILAWNSAAVKLYGWSETEALEMNFRDRIPKGRREETLSKLHHLSQGDALEPFLTQRVTKNGSLLDVSVISSALVNETGQFYAIATTERAKESEQEDHTQDSKNDRPG
jgi:two-component system CheB/CheR fusion protein